MSSTKEYVRDTIIKENVEPRLISSASRTGRVIWQDDFESYTSALTEKWTQTLGTISLVTTLPFRGKSCAKNLTAASVGAQAQMARNLALSGNTRIGIEFYWYVDNALADIDYVGFLSGLYDGTNSTQAGFNYNFTSAAGNQKWQYLNSANSTVDVPSGTQNIYYLSGAPAWNHFKAIIDFGNAKYGPVYSNQNTLALNGVAMYVTGSAQYPHMYVSMSVTAKTATAISLYIDDVIITDQEP